MNRSSPERARSTSGKENERLEDSKAESAPGVGDPQGVLCLQVTRGLGQARVGLKGKNAGL